MKRFINWLLVIGALVGVFYLVGLIVPRSRTRKCETDIQSRPDDLYAYVSDVSTWPDWFPDVVSARQGPEKNKYPTWTLTFEGGGTAVLEVIDTLEGRSWQCFYLHEGSRHTLRFIFAWFGEGSRIQLTKIIDTRDPWDRAKLFLWIQEEGTPLGVLNALGLQFGETVKVREKS